jgi:glycosyltransferase involved in cell wall biosynthesis
MHILLIHQAFVTLNEPGGTRHYELARYLAIQGYRISIITSPISYLTGKPVEEDDTNESFLNGGSITIFRPYAYKALHKSFIHRVFNFISFMISSFIVGLRIRDVDLIWGTSPPIFQGITAWGLSFIKRTPFLFEVRDLWPAFAIQVGVLKQPVLIWASEWLEKFLYRRADKVIVNSPGFIQHVDRLGAKETDLVPNGVDLNMFTSLQTGVDFRQANDLEGKFVALYAGAHGMSNDLEIILEAAHFLKPHTEIIIVLLGDGKEKTNLIKKANEAYLDNIRFLPPVPKSQMPVALAAANACIAILKPIPLYATVYPNKVFDYMAAARPVICVIDGVIREVVENASAGIFVPPGDPQSLADTILYLSKNREKSQAMGCSGRKYVEENFDRSMLAEKMTKIMKEMLRK